ncbi:MAG: hypothetical protein PHT07_04200 [Paludibacter sp.]|nr:hypothetical protein [Paludibacter sp.]
MKRSIQYLLLLLLIPISGHSQELLNNTVNASNDAIQQILLPGIDGLLHAQSMNQDVRNFEIIQQTGNQNTATINQQNGSNPDMSNQSYIVQSGNSNELAVGQIGSGNVLLGFQLGYLATLFESRNSGILIRPNTAGISTEINNYLMVGEHNTMNITQNGNDNGIMAVQQGSGNTIEAEQIGDNNYLMALQRGSNNSLTGYKQENESGRILFDRVIQIGDNLNLKSSEVSKSSINGNTFMQNGTNLALEIKSDILNSAGGIEINQTGKDMKVVIDQSYFSFPMK